MYTHEAYLGYWIKPIVKLWILCCLWLENWCNMPVLLLCFCKLNRSTLLNKHHIHLDDKGQVLRK